jgi:hypothetical protein
MNLKKVQKWNTFSTRFVQMTGIFNRIKDGHWQREPGFYWTGSRSML